MSDPSDRMAAGRDALAELRELGMAAAREAQARMMAADEAKAFADYSLALQRCARLVRQTVALEEKLIRSAEAAARQDAGAGREAAKARGQRRKDRLSAILTRAIWNEADSTEEGERLVGDLEDLICERALADDFTETDLWAEIARLCRELGVSVPEPLEPEPLQPEPAATLSPQAPSCPHPQPALEPSPGSKPDDGEWRSSA